MGVVVRNWKPVFKISKSAFLYHFLINSKGTRIRDSRRRRRRMQKEEWMRRQYQEEEEIVVKKGVGEGVGSCRSEPVGHKRKWLTNLLIVRKTNIQQLPIYIQTSASTSTYMQGIASRSKRKKSVGQLSLINSWKKTEFKNQLICTSVIKKSRLVKTAKNDIKEVCIIIKKSNV